METFVVDALIEIFSLASGKTDRVELSLISIVISLLTLEFVSF